MASTLANIGYNSIAKALTMAVGVATSAILARTLDADDYGVVGLAMIVIGFLGRFGDVGMSAALVQRRSVDEHVMATAQTLNLILAALVFLCALAAAPFTASAFDNAAVPRVVCILACTFLISAIGFLPSALLTRDLRFAELRVPSVAGTVVRGIVAVACALTGWKYWSLVAGTLTGSLTTCLLLRVVLPGKAGWRINRAIALQLLRFGLPIFLSGLMVFAVFNIDKVMIGSILGATQLGFYTIALMWATYVCNTLYETVHSVLFPRFSKAQHSRAELAEMYRRSLRAVMFAAVMVNVTLFSVADGFLVVVLGRGSPKWMPALTTLQILCLYGAVRAAVEPVGNVIMALGRSKLFLANLFPIAAELCFLPIVAPRWGLPGVAWLVCGAYALQWLVYGPFLRREVGIPSGAVLRIVLPVSIAAAPTVLLAWTIEPPNPWSWATLALRAGAACATFIVAHEILTRGSMLTELRRLVSVPNR